MDFLFLYSKIVWMLGPAPRTSCKFRTLSFDSFMRELAEVTTQLAIWQNSRGNTA